MGTNRYAYALNDPINLRDPSGRSVDPDGVYAGETTDDATRDYKAAEARGEISVAQAGGIGDDDQTTPNDDLSLPFQVEVYDPLQGGWRTIGPSFNPSNDKLNIPTLSGAAPLPGSKGGPALGLSGKLPNDRITGPPSRRGGAPIGDDGHPVEIHHEEQSPNSLKTEMTRTDHRLGENYTKNHPNTGQQPSLIDRNEFARERRDYWSQEWDSGKFDRFRDEE